MHEKKFGQKSKNWKFLVLIDRASTEYQSSQAEARLEKSRNFRLIKNHTRSIKILENWIFWKIVEDLCRKHSNQLILWMKCMSMSLKVFKNICFQPWTSKTRFSLFTPKFQPTNIFCIKIIEYIILDGQTKFAHNFMYKI